MARKSTDYVSNEIRMREGLRLKIEVAAREHETSMNTEMVSRLEASFDEEVRFNDIANLMEVAAGGKENADLPR